MENATKALLIAGSILIVIIIIGFGVVIVNSGSGMSESASSTLDEMEIQAFNSEFTGFEGTLNAKTMKSLMEKVETKNLGKDANDFDYVNLVDKDGKNILTDSTTSFKISTGKKYEVSLVKDSDTGLYTTIKVEVK